MTVLCFRTSAPNYSVLSHDTGHMATVVDDVDMLMMMMKQKGSEWGGGMAR